MKSGQLVEIWIFLFESFTEFLLKICPHFRAFGLPLKYNH